MVRYSGSSCSRPLEKNGDGESVSPFMVAGALDRPEPEYVRPKMAPWDWEPEAFDDLRRLPTPPPPPSPRQQHDERLIVGTGVPEQSKKKVIFAGEHDGQLFDWDALDDAAEIEREVEEVAGVRCN